MNLFQQTLLLLVGLFPRCTNTSTVFIAVPLTNLAGRPLCENLTKMTKQQSKTECALICSRLEKLPVWSETDRICFCAVEECHVLGEQLISLERLNIGIFQGIQQVKS